MANPSCWISTIIVLEDGANATMVVNYIRERDAVIRPESFSQETKVIQSGLNMTQITFFPDVESAKDIIWTSKLWCQTNNYELRGYIMYTQVIAFNQTNGSVHSEYFSIDYSFNAIYNAPRIVYMLCQLSTQRITYHIDCVPIPILVQYPLKWWLVHVFELSFMFLMPCQNS